MRHIETFRRSKTPLESLIAPRPLAGTMQASYYALMRLEHQSALYSYFAKIGKLEPIDEMHYLAEVGTIRYSWGA
jgi:hypothetical protein